MTQPQTPPESTPSPDDVARLGALGSTALAWIQHGGLDMARSLLSELTPLDLTRIRHTARVLAGMAQAIQEHGPDASLAAVTKNDYEVGPTDGNLVAAGAVCQALRSAGHTPDMPTDDKPATNRFLTHFSFLKSRYRVTVERVHGTDQVES